MFNSFFLRVSFSILLVANSLSATDVSSIYGAIGELRATVARNQDRLTEGDVSQIVSFLDAAITKANSPGGVGGAVVKACGDVFGSGSSGQTCASKANNAEVVRACGKGFGSGSSGLDCAINALRADSVEACVTGFGSGTSGLACAKSAFSGDIVSACVAGFGSGMSGKTCAEKARSAEKVRECVKAFGSGSSGLNCAIGVN